jgi:4-amino-4-deoxy-L-arabinose transferase-like glycosyltransferase
VTDKRQPAAQDSRGLEPKTALWIFAIALVARLIWIVTLKNSFYWSDEETFAGIARHLVHGDGYISDSYRANFVMPVYMSLVFRFFGENLLIGRLGLSVFGSLTCVLIGSIAARLFSSRTGLLSGLGLALYPPHIYFAGVFYAEGIMIFWGAAAVYSAVRAMTSAHRTLWAVAAGVTLGIGSLTRTLVIPWFACICLAWLLHAGRDWRGWWRPCAALLLAGAACILPWTYRNYLVYHAFIPVQTGFGVSLMEANNPFSNGSHEDWNLDPGGTLWNDRLAQLPAGEREAVEAEYGPILQKLRQKPSEMEVCVANDQVLGPVGVHYLVHHPGHAARCAWRRFQSLYSPFSQTVNQNEHTRPIFKLIAALSTYPVFLLAAFGMIRYAARFRRLSLLYLVIGSVTFLLCIMTGTQTRYRLTLDPYFMIFAAAFVVQLAQWTGWRDRSAGAPQP